MICVTSSHVWQISMHLGGTHTSHTWKISTSSFFDNWIMLQRTTNLSSPKVVVLLTKATIDLLLRINDAGESLLNFNVAIRKLRF